ncbi:MAG: S-methyl-5-thioribose-1-phosphate isomerase, partial [Spartobacteria bacterium]|nr:S-methyl-5-thioribose-1-phosphate isomerase [Spartobacteria bacterium]
AAGDVANKIGTYLKALAARDNGVPFYAVLPSSTIDWSIEDGVRDIPIEERGSEEVRFMTGWDDAANHPATVRICPEKTPAANYGFDVTPARLVTGILTERGLAPATRAGLRALYADLHP